MHSTRRLTFASTCRRMAGVIALLATACLAPAQSPLPDDFNPGADAGVAAFAVQPDGKILVGGTFGKLDGQTRNHIGRLNTDGTLDSTFNPNASGSVNAIAIQSDERILVKGSFTYIAGQARQGLARLNPDGSPDNGFNLVFERNDGYAPTVDAIAVQPDGRILVGGRFTSIGGVSRTNIARLSADGAVDESFNAEADVTVRALAAEPGGKTLLAGWYYPIAAQPCRYLARLNANGSLDVGFNPELSSPPNTLLVQSDGKILVGGWFTAIGGQPRTNLARLNSDGTLDGGFTANANNKVHSLALESDGKILLGGYFTRIGAQTRNYLARLNPDGSLDDSFNPGAGNEVWSLAVQTDGKVLVGGRFGTLAGVKYRSGLGRLNTTRPATQSLSQNGSSVTWLRGGCSPEVLWTTFDVWTNGLNWLRLGNGTRIQGGWEIVRPNLLPSATVRARGCWAVGGYADASYGVVESFCGMVAIPGQPLARTNDAGTLATFSVSANGSGPLGYQWFQNGLPLTDAGSISGTQSAMLSVSNVFGVDAGRYSVIVTNGYGSVTSAVANLTVHDPLITSQPSSLVRTQGQNASLTVGVLGSAPLGYQWRKDGIAVAGATDSSLLLTNVQVLNAGHYDVVITNRYAVKTSAVATLTVRDPVITAQPASQNLELGQAATLSVVAAGTSVLSTRS